MSEVWNTYIQVNIYGRTLKDLQKDGICLKSVLSDIGCSKTWIGEGSIYDGESSDQEKTIIDLGPVFSTTLATTRAPFFSTPAVSLVDPLSKLNTCFPGDLSAIGSNTGSEFNDSSDGDNDSQSGEKSLNGIVSSLNALAEEPVKEPRKMEAKPAGTMRSISTVPPRFPLRRSRRRISAPQFKPSLNRQETKASLTGSCYFDPVPSFHFDEDDIPANVSEKVYETLAPMQFNNSFPDFTDAPTPFRQDTSILIEGSLSREPSSSVLKKRKVSFVIPEVEKDKEMDKVHTIKCRFEGCKKSFSWKKKYGKSRLIDHALTHHVLQKFQCPHCKFKTRTVLNLQKHHRKAHKDVQVMALRLKNMVQSASQDNDFMNIWKICFEDDLNSAGGDFDPFARRDKNSKRSKKTTVVEEDD